MLQQHFRNISNTKNSVSSGYPNTEKRGNKYKRSLVKSFKKTKNFRQTELLSSTDKTLKNKGERNLNIMENSHKLKDKSMC